MAGWDITTAAHVYSLDVSSETATPVQAVFGDSGTKLYVFGDGVIYQYTCSTPYMLSSASYASKSKDVSASGNITFAITADGTTLYVGDQDASSDAVYQWSMSSAWDISTASDDSVSLVTNSQDATLLAIALGDSDTKLYVSGSSNDTIYQYDISSGLGSGSYASKSLDVSSLGTNTRHVAWRPDGTRFFYLERGSDTVIQFSCSTAWDISTASADSGKTYVVTSTEGSPFGLYARPGGEHFYVSGSDSGEVHQFSLDVVAAATALDASPTLGTHTTAEVFASATALDASATIGTHSATSALYAAATALDASPTLGTSDVAFVSIDQSFTQSYRVADAQYDVYELYVGEDGSPDFSASAQPVDSGALPLSYTPTPPASGSTLELHCVVRRRNSYNLLSFNVGKTVLEIDSGGSQLSGPLTAPFGVRVFDGAAEGAITVVASYASTDDTNPATAWEVYVGNGSDPTPGSDTPLYTGTMAFIGAYAYLATTITNSAFGAGDTVHVIVTAKRASDSERASAAAVQFAVAAALTLSAGETFGGAAYEQR